MHTGGFRPLCAFSNVFWITVSNEGERMFAYGRFFAGLAILACIWVSTAASGATRTTCPDKILDTITVQGTYLGWFNTNKDSQVVGIKLRDEDETFYIPATKEEAQKYFGNVINQEVSLTYNLKQMLVAGVCVRMEMLAGGQPVQPAKSARQPQIFIYREPERSGELRITELADGRLNISIETVSSAQDTCEFEGECAKSGDIIRCPNPDDPKNVDSFMELRAIKGGYEVANEIGDACGNRGTMTGRYLK